MPKPWSPEFELEYFRGVADGELLGRHKIHAEIFDLENVLPILQPNPPETVAEIGCGGIGGMLTAYRGGLYRYAVDPLAEEYAAANPEVAEQYGFHWRKGFAREIPLDTGSVDVAFCLETLDHCPSLADFQHSQVELVRILKPGGVLAFMIPARDSRPEGHDGHPTNPHGALVHSVFTGLGLHLVDRDYRREGTWLLLQAP